MTGAAASTGRGVPSGGAGTSQGQGQCVVPGGEMGPGVSSELSLLSAVIQAPSQHCREAEGEGWELGKAVSRRGHGLGRCRILAGYIAAPSELRDDDLKQVQRERVEGSKASEGSLRWGRRTRLAPSGCKQPSPEDGHGHPGGRSSAMQRPACPLRTGRQCHCPSI